MKALVVLTALAGCAGQTGTVTVELATAPGSTLLDGVQTLRLVLTNPRRETTAERTSSGFDLAIELPATTEAGALLVDGLDAAGTVIASGASPRFPLGAIDGHVIIYMAAPNSIGPSLVALTPRSELAAGALAYGAIFAGGRLETGAPSDAITIYNAFNHTLAVGMPLLAPRAAPALGIGANGIVYLFGGRGPEGTPTATFWRFDTTVSPNGGYIDLGDKEGLARADQTAVPLGNDHFLVTGAPPIETLGLDGSVVAKSEQAALPAAGVTITGNDGITASIFAGAEGVVRFRSNAFTTLDIPTAARAGASVIALPGGKAGVVCGGVDLIRIDGASGAAETLANIPSQVKTGCAAAITARHLVIAGGTLAAGGVDTLAEIYDSTTLALVASQPLVVPRTGAVAIALPNDQVLIAGGIDAAGAPVGVLELFTPGN